ncbi:MAG: hypothetical protein J0I99_15980 [Devosia sp.]|uniref:hypothetical protein n=1 Tax=Devosia sp. TaxID=1871048 RepID=UPI001AC067C4|nr:hypothetical protein [Devosia sp.]MBN9308510.1 hypothetical protein [Devosia sp.]MBN9317242.1 hypothetical protein [Devosia sp.]
MRSLRSLFVAAIVVGLASPALAQTDPHHPEATGAAPAVEGTETAPAVVGTDAAPSAGMPATTTPGSDMSACPDMMSMMKMMMQSGSGDAQSMQMMQMMQMMQSMQMMQMQLMQQMQQMQQMRSGAAPMGPDLPAEGASP